MSTNPPGLVSPDQALRTVRVLRVALANAVGEVERLGGCSDDECRDESCWLGALDDDLQRQETVRALMFILDREMGDV